MPQSPPETLDLSTIIAHAKEYGFVFPSSEIYEGLQAVYDYGPNGVALKNNLKAAWWATMTRFHDQIVGIDSSIFMHPLIWKASGHVDAFNDPMIDNRDSKKRYRADVLIEEHVEQLRQKGETVQADRVIASMVKALEAGALDDVRALIVDEGIKCPVSGTTNWTEVRQFNLMFSTQMGSLADEADRIYLRPETAQGIFVNFLNVQKSARMKVPFGIAQIGKAFRNEIVARQFIFRMREFEQMEMQFFVRPGTEDEFYDYWRTQRMHWHRTLGLAPDRLRYHDHDKLAHYARAAVDIEYAFPFGFKEIEGIHSRTDFDLKSHQELSGKKLQYHDPYINQNYIPYVIETSVGADRLFLATLSEAYTKVTGITADGAEKERTYLNLPPALAPTKAAILPLVKKDGLPEIGQELFRSLRLSHDVSYDEKDTVGKRYTRNDLIGTPYCIVIDQQTKTDETVTIRDRNTAEQRRVPIAEVRAELDRNCTLESLLAQLPA